MKTLIGKNGYLFLQNDSCKEIEVHNNNLCLVDLQFYKRYETILDKFLFIVIPNKSLIYAEHLPDIYNLQYRPGFDLYSNYNYIGNINKMIQDHALAPGTYYD